MATSTIPLCRLCLLGLKTRLSLALFYYNPSLRSSGWPFLLVRRQFSKLKDEKCARAPSVERIVKHLNKAFVNVQRWPVSSVWEICIKFRLGRGDDVSTVYPGFYTVHTIGYLQLESWPSYDYRRTQTAYEKATSFRLFQEDTAKFRSTYIRLAAVREVIHALRLP